MVYLGLKPGMVGADESTELAVPPTGSFFIVVF